MSHPGKSRRAPSLRMSSRASLAALVLVVLMILPPSAAFASGADPTNPSLDQYVESVPGAHGSSGGGSGGGGSSHTPAAAPLPASVQHKIETQGGPDAKQLEAVGTSPSLGAPPAQKKKARKHSTEHSSAPSPAPADTRPSSISAVTTAATHGDGSVVGVLVIGLVLVTVIAGAVALVRRRATAG